MCRCCTSREMLEGPEPRERLGSDVTDWNEVKPMLKSRSNGGYSVDRRCRMHARCIPLREVYTASWDAEVSRERADRAERGDDHRSVIASQICRTLCRSYSRSSAEIRDNRPSAKSFPREFFPEDLNEGY